MMQPGIPDYYGRANDIEACPRRMITLRGRRLFLRFLVVSFEDRISTNGTFAQWRASDFVRPRMPSLVMTVLAVLPGAVEGQCMKIAFQAEARSGYGLKRSKNDDLVMVVTFLAVGMTAGGRKGDVAKSTAWFPTDLLHHRF